MKIEKPPVKWIGSPFYGYPGGTRGRGDYKVIAIVDHLTTRTLEEMDAWFNSEESGGVSAHFGVGRKGEIHQYVRLGDVARHVGNVEEPDWALLIPDVDPNWYTIGLVHVGDQEEKMPEAQFRATLALHRWLIDIFSLEVNKNTIIDYNRINSANKKNYTGPDFPWEGLFRGLAAASLPFSDVPYDHWAVEAVLRMYKKRIMAGYPDNTFKGEEKMTRYELAAVLDRFLKSLENNKKA